MTAVRVVMVMPPVTALEPSLALDQWPTLTATAEALRCHGEAEPVVICRTNRTESELVRDEVRYVFAPTDRRLVELVLVQRPHVVHLHGLGFTRLIARLGRQLRGAVPIVVQHHGEQLLGWRSAAGHRAVRRFIAGYLFTGAATGQGDALIERGIVRRDARLFEVLESASLVPPPDRGSGPAVELEGDPAILWVGRLVASKEPVLAVEAFALAAAAAERAQLHLLATDRTLEPEVRLAIRASAAVSNRIHLHEGVPRAEMAGWYSAADVYFSTSRREGSNYSLIESLSFGCAPVVSAIAPHRAIVGDLAPLFAPGDAATAAKLLGEATSIDADEVRRHSDTHHTWPVVVEQLLAAYRAVS